MIFVQRPAWHASPKAPIHPCCETQTIKTNNNKKCKISIRHNWVFPRPVRPSIRGLGEGKLLSCVGLQIGYCKTVIVKAACVFFPEILCQLCLRFHVPLLHSLLHLSTRESQWRRERSGDSNLWFHGKSKRYRSDVGNVSCRVYWFMMHALSEDSLISVAPGVDECRISFLWCQSDAWNSHKACLTAMDHFSILACVIVGCSAINAWVHCLPWNRLDHSMAFCCSLAFTNASWTVLTIPLSFHFWFSPLCSQPLFNALL